MKQLTKSFFAVMMALVFTVAASAAADGFFTDSSGNDVPYREFFSIDYPYDILKPGQTYYFPCDWGGEELTESFFEYYIVSINVNSPFTAAQKTLPEYLSPSAAKRRVEEASFVKNSDGSYFFKFKASNSFSYVNDTSVIVAITARDKRDADYRGQVVMELDIGYAQNAGNPNHVYESPYEVDPDSPNLEFDGELSECRLDFEDGSYYQIRLSSRKSTFGFAYNNEVNQAIAAANKNAKLYFLSFPASPRPAYEGLLRVFAPGSKYLYEIGKNNELTLVATHTGEGDYIGFVTKNLGSYVASDQKLGAAVMQTPSGGQTGAGAAQVQPDVSRLTNIMSQYFKNPGIVLAFRDGHAQLASAVTLKSKPDLTNIKAPLYVYAYNGSANQLIRLVDAKAYIDADGYLFFNTRFEGLHVITSGALELR
jgi:hypothetical protein